MCFVSVRFKGWPDNAALTNTQAAPADDEKLLGSFGGR